MMAWEGKRRTFKDLEPEKIWTGLGDDYGSAERKDTVYG
jgi:hypothetical protein